MKLFTAASPELKCPCPACRADSSSLGLEPQALTVLNNMQKHLFDEDSRELAISVSSGRRCAAHNAALSGSARNSQHLEGLAFDIPTNSNAELAYYIVNAAMIENVRFIEVTPSHVHCDLRAGPVGLIVKP